MESSPDPHIAMNSPQNTIVWLLALTFFQFATYSAQGQVGVRLDPQSEKYVASKAIVGEHSLRLVGSGTMRSLATRWGKAFSDFYPSVRIEIDEKGSGNAIPALIQGQASFGLMSRSPKNTEIESFKERFGYEPKLVPTCLRHVGGIRTP